MHISSKTLEINGFHFKFIDSGRYNPDYPSGIVINMHDKEMMQAALTGDNEFFKSLEDACSYSFELSALNIFENEKMFLGWNTMAGSWRDLVSSHSFPDLEWLKGLAEILLKGTLANDEQRDVANKLLQTLDGNPPEEPERQYSELEKKQNKFKRIRNRLFRDLVKRDGYKCAKCDCKPDQLCVSHTIQLKDGGESVLDNLSLKCRKCFSKSKGKASQ